MLYKDMGETFLYVLLQRAVFPLGRVPSLWQPASSLYGQGNLDLLVLVINIAPTGVVCLSLALYSTWPDLGIRGICKELAYQLDVILLPRGIAGKRVRRGSSNGVGVTVCRTRQTSYYTLG